MHTAFLEAWRRTEARKGCGSDEMRKISIRLTEKHYEMLEALVLEGEYASVSEAIRDAIRRLLQEKAEIIERSRNLSSYR